MALSDVRIIDIPRFGDPRGNLSFIQNGERLTFDISRVYWIYDVPADAERYGHAFDTQKELIVALSGAFDVAVSDGHEERTYHLDRAYKGLLVPPLTWRRIDNFTTNSVAMVLSSTLYDSADYIEDFSLFKTIVDNEQQ